ncbi:response regulator [Vampirovibrio sp.]|uniref:response regulator n=1 Tax=Vampirovibrio sp. TaxID=2717857 RepID=UPI0035938AF7
MHKPIQILLIEDDPVWQEAIKALLSSTVQFELAAIAEDMDSALLAYQRKTPEIILLDWQILGEKDGIEVGKILLSQGVPSEHIVLISGANPSSIPKHPFLYVPKPLIATDLLPLLASVTQR